MASAQPKHPTGKRLGARTAHGGRDSCHVLDRIRETHDQLPQHCALTNFHIGVCLHVQSWWSCLFDPLEACWAWWQQAGQQQSRARSLWTKLGQPNEPNRCVRSGLQGGAAASHLAVGWAIVLHVGGASRSQQHCQEGTVTWHVLTVLLMLGRSCLESWHPAKRCP